MIFMKSLAEQASRGGVIVLAAIYLFAGSLAGFALAGVLFALANRHGEETPTGCEHVWEPWGEPEKSRVWGTHGEEHPIAYIYRQSRVCLSCNETDYKTRRIDA